jgi:uncharacterized protein (TIGR03083 family)
MGNVAHAESFGIASESFIALVERIDPEQWGDPGLGVWTVRELVGHTSRAMSTVETYLSEAPATVMTIPDAETYYSDFIGKYTDDDAIAARGVEAGAKLSDDPIGTLTALAVRASAAAAAADPDRLVAVGSVGGVGIPLEQYLRTRVFELVVHGIDIARATGLDYRYPDSVVSETAVLAASVAVRKGHGEVFLTAMTGRGALPAEFSIL